MEDVKEIKIDDFLAHHGTKGMHWGVWNDETKRKYGILGPKRVENKKVDTPAEAKVESKRGIAAQVVERYRQNKAAKRQAAEERQVAERKVTAEDAEIQRKYGITKEQYDAAREATLNSNDPRVVIKGMRYLSDKELSDKISRLEQEGKIKKMAADQRKETASTVKAELEARQQTIPYRLGKMVAKTVVDQYFSPVMRDAAKQTSASLTKLGQRAVNKARQETKTSKQEVAQAKERVQDAKAEVKLERETLRVQKEKKKEQRQTIEKQVNVETGKALVDAILKHDKEQQSKGEA